MVGSMKWFVYTTDAGDDFGIFRDESNVEAVNGGTQDYPNAGAIVYAVPNNLKPRLVTYESNDGSVRRDIVALTQTIYNGIAAGATMTDQATGLTLTFVRKKGEVVRIPRGIDTGITDGDNT